MIDGFEVGNVALKMRILAEKLRAFVELLLGEPGDGIGGIGWRFDRSEGEEGDGGEPVGLNEGP